MRAKFMSRGITVGLVVLATTATVVACSSSDDSAPAAGGAGAGGASANGGSSGAHHGGRSAGGSTSDGGSPNAGEGGAAGDAAGGFDSAAGAGGEQPGTVVVVEPGVCARTAMWKGATPVTGLSTTSEEKLLSLTLDELDIAFLRDGTLYRAHRTTPSIDFGTAIPVTLPAGYDASAGVALSNDGLTLILVSSAGTAFGSVSRSTRDADFSTSADTTAFASLNARAAQTLEHFAAPVLSFAGSTLIFAAFSATPGSLSVVYEATLSNGAWSMPNNIGLNTIDRTGPLRALPSGLSADARTLFYFDEKTNTEIASFRDRPDAPFYEQVDLGALGGATPNAKCDRIYYTASGNVLFDTD